MHIRRDRPRSNLYNDHVIIVGVSYKNCFTGPYLGPWGCALRSKFVGLGNPASCFE